MSRFSESQMEILLICKAAFEGFFKEDQQMFAEMMSDIGGHLCRYDENTRDEIREELLFSLEKQAAGGITLNETLSQEEKTILKIALLSFMVLDKGDSAELIVMAEKILDEELEQIPQELLDETKKTLVTKKYGERLAKRGE